MLVLDNFTGQFSLHCVSRFIYMDQVERVNMAVGSHWREAATLIIASRIGQKIVSTSSNNCDYVLPLLKRSNSSKFMANAYVFPGGVVDAADFSPDWLKVFKGRDLGRDHSRHRPPILQADTYLNFQKVFGDRKILDPDFALRLTAIRETFEESGIFLAKTNEVNNNKDKKTIHSLEDLSSWRSRVSKDASQFIRMCEELQCCPDVWSLHEWSNWLTPTNKAWFQRRFDTIFFVCTLNEIPQMEVDNGEISNFQWCSPSEALKLCRDEKIWMAPPQIYEISRLQAFKKVKELEDFSVKRATLGLERWYPNHVIALDGIVSFLPGDEMYSTDLDATEEDPTLQTIDKTMLSIRKESKMLNRIEMHGPQMCHPVCNIELPFGHVSPLEQPDIFNHKL